RLILGPRNVSCLVARKWGGGRVWRSRFQNPFFGVRFPAPASFVRVRGRRRSAVAVHGDYSGCRLWKMAVLEVCVGVHHSFFRFPFSTSLCRRRGRATNYALRCRRSTSRR